MKKSGSKRLRMKFFELNLNYESKRVLIVVTLELGNINMFSRIDQFDASWSSIEKTEGGLTAVKRVL
jgi:hypothetical protein